MAENEDILQRLSSEYSEGFTTDIEQEFFPKGLNEDIVRALSAKKGEPQWMLDFRLDALRKWQAMKMPTWGHLTIPPIDYQDIIYFAAPKAPKKREEPEEDVDKILDEYRDKAEKEPSTINSQLNNASGPPLPCSLCRGRIH